MACLTNLFTPLTVLVSIIMLFDSAYWVTVRALESYTVFEELPGKEVILTSASVLSLIGIVSCRKPLLAFTFALMIYATCATMFNMLQVSHIMLKSDFDVCRTIQYRNVPCWFINSFITGSSVVAYILTTLAAMATYDRLTTVTVSIGEQRAYATHRAQPLLLSSRPIVSPDDFDREEQRYSDSFV